MDNERTIQGSPPDLSGFPGELGATLRQGRWLLTGAELLVSLYVLAQGQSAAVWLTLTSLTFYNVVSIRAVPQTASYRFIVPLMFGLDLFFVLIAARLTGGIQSPFLWHCYLIILAAALWYELPGGISVAAASSAIVVAAQGYPLTLSHLQVPLIANLIPSYFLVGAFTGFLVRRLKSYYRRSVAARLREQSSAQEMLLARDMQKAYLPSRPPRVPGLECAFLTRFAGEIGGDFLLFLSPEPDRDAGSRLGITIGDVTGKGIPAALGATGIAHLLPWLNPMEDPKRALRNLNDDLNERLPETYYATLLFVQIGMDKVRLWTAGHPPALLFRASEGRVVTGEAVADPPLGLFPTWEGYPQELAWSVGDTLVLYTDGASETRNNRGEQFTAERVAEVLSQCAANPAENILQAILKAVETWGTPIDDLTLVVCKRTDVHAPEPSS